MPGKTVNAFDYKVISSIVTSKHLKREVRVDFYFPASYAKNSRILFLNDGQDAEAIQLKLILELLSFKKNIHPVIVVAIHANENRLNE